MQACTIGKGPGDGAARQALLAAYAAFPAALQGLDVNPGAFIGAGRRHGCLAGV